MLGNLSQALFPIQHLITGGSYILGLLFFLMAINKFKAIGGSKSSQEKMHVPMMYLVFGAGLLYLPTGMSTLANTAFGVGNILTYTYNDPYNVLTSMGLIIRTAGVLWFVRGSVLLAHASEPGVKDGPKGLVFIVAGVFAMNFDNTIATLNSIIGHIVSMSISFKESQGY